MEKSAKDKEGDVLMGREAIKLVKDYYNNNHFFYRFFWMNKKNLAMHFGFWDKGTKNLHEALINENQYMADLLKINKNDKLLDAGCGVGGTAIWVAEKYGAKVTGVSISEKQIVLANKYAKGRHVAGLANFILCDYCNVDLPEETFDKIYGMESICHAEDKSDFLKEAFRLLKKGGKLIVLDGFLTKDSMDKKGMEYYKEFCKGWAIPNLSSTELLGENMRKVGYKNIEYVDVTDKVLKSSNELYASSKYVYPLTRLLYKLHLTPEQNVLAEKGCMAQYHIFKEKIGVYGVFTGEKQ